jgi:Zn-dependent protease
LPPLNILIPSFLVLLISLSFHEAAHAWAATRLGDSTARQLGRLTLNPLAHIDWVGTVLFPLILMTLNAPVIGWAKPVPVDVRNLREPRRDFALIALAGPVSNLILAGMAAGIFAFVRPQVRIMEAMSPMATAVLMAVLINVLLAVFNMIPIPPLDGGNVLLGVAPLPLARAVSWLRPYGFVILYALMFLGVLNKLLLPIETWLFGWLL